MKIIDLFVLLLLFNAVLSGQGKRVISGAEVLLTKEMKLIVGKRIGIITNHTAILPNDKHIIDEIFKNPSVNILTLFGPEHGIRGDAAAGEHISSSTDEKTKIPIISLYGERRKATKEMLKDIDVLLFDIQDVGARFYTYISTLFYGIQAAAENDIEIIVLDRPNPIGGLKVDGPVLDKEHISFVGIAPLPIMHGMTVGELAKYFVGEKLVGNFNNVKLTVVKMENWTRDMYFDECQLPWLSPSPNIPSLNTAVVYPGTCLIEATNVSEGRGTYNPFLTIGAPFINSDELIHELSKYAIEGILIKKVEFIPDSIPSMVNNPKQRGKLCKGIKIEVTDREKFEPVKFGFILLHSLKKLFKEFEIREKSYYRLGGKTSGYKQLISLVHPEEIFKSWEEQLNEFLEIRKKYLLY